MLLIFHGTGNPEEKQLKEKLAGQHIEKGEYGRKADGNSHTDLNGLQVSSMPRSRMDFSH